MVNVVGVKVALNPMIRKRNNSIYISTISIMLMFHLKHSTTKPVRLVCFDFDNVLVDGNFLVTAMKLLDNEAADLKMLASLLKGTRDPDYFEVFIRHLAQLMKGFEVKKLRGLITLLKPMKGLKTTFKHLKKHGIKVVILSTNDERLIKEFLNRNEVLEYVDSVYGTVMGVEDGKLNGDFKGNLTPHQKLTSLREIMKKYNVSLDQLIYVGDGLTDMPIFEKIEKGIVFCPDPITKIAVLTNDKTVDRINAGELYLIHEKDLKGVLEFV